MSFFRQPVPPWRAFLRAKRCCAPKRRPSFRPRSSMSRQKVTTTVHGRWEGENEGRVLEGTTLRTACVTSSRTVRTSAQNVTSVHVWGRIRAGKIEYSHVVRAPQTKSRHTADAARNACLVSAPVVCVSRVGRQARQNLSASHHQTVPVQNSIVKASKAG